MSAVSLKLTVGGREIELDLGTGGTSGEIRYRLGDQWKSALVRWDPAGLSVALENEVTEFDLLAGDGESGPSYLVRRRASARVSGVQPVLRAGEGALRQAAGGRSRVTRVKAQMPGKIIRVLVAADAIVEAGQPLLVMEAMKMENEIRAPMAGQVQSLNAQVGSAVETGAELLSIAQVSNV